MKKLTKNTLKQMAALLPELDEEDQRSILGGTATTAIPPDYTGSIPVTISTVTGSYDVTGYYTSSTTALTGVSQAVTGAFSFEEMDQMIDNGKWTGGYVDGIGYIGEATYVTGYYQVATGAIIPDSLDSGWGQNAEEDLPWYQDLLMSTGGGYCRFMNQDEIQAFQENVEVNAELSVSSGIGISSPFFKVMAGEQEEGSLGYNNHSDENGLQGSLDRIGASVSVLGFSYKQELSSSGISYYSLGFDYKFLQFKIEGNSQGGQSLYIGTGVGIGVGFLGEINAELGIGERIQLK